MARRKMLRAAGVPFEAVAPVLDEEAAKADLKGLSGVALAEALAERKALALAAAAEELVLGSDQVLETQDGEMLSKPNSRDELFHQLQALSGKTHRLHSAAAIAEEGRIVWQAREGATMTMRKLTPGFVQTYLDREYEAVRRGVGGYHVEGAGVQLFERIEGSHFAVLGMPLLPLLGYLRERGVLAS
jgi:septum formation protein